MKQVILSDLCKPEINILDLRFGIYDFVIVQITAKFAKFAEVMIRKRR